MKNRELWTLLLQVAGVVLAIQVPMQMGAPLWVPLITAVVASVALGAIGDRIRR